MTHRLVAILLFSLLAGTTFACDSKRMSDVSQANYPVDFHYITKQEIRSTMGELATEVVALDALLSKQGGPTADDREKVLEILSRMRTLAGQLKTGWRSSHPRLDRYAPQLRSEIDRARDEVRMFDPPSYYRVGQLVGACTYCHVPRYEEEH